MTTAFDHIPLSLSWAERLALADNWGWDLYAIDSITDAEAAIELAIELFPFDGDWTLQMAFTSGWAAARRARCG